MPTLLALFARTNSITQSDAAAANPFQPLFLAVLLRQLAPTSGFTFCRQALYTAFLNMWRPRYHLSRCLPYAVALLFLLAFWPRPARSQDAAQKPVEQTVEKKAEKTAPQKKELNPAQIELLETRYRFESNGDSRKEIHARVKINSELGVRQFARLNFDYNRSFESVDIPLVRITHASGGTAEILPGAITDNPNPTVVNAPAYQDVRVKSVRILGLQPGDTLEYRVITAVMHHPLAPDFWLEHSFDRSGVVSQEFFELNLPSSPSVKIQINPATPPDATPAPDGTSGERIVYRWTWKQPSTSEMNSKSNQSKPDITLTTFSSWNQLADRLAAHLIPSEQDSRELSNKATSLVGRDAGPDARMSDIYDFVSKKVRTVDLPLGATGFQAHKPAATLAAGYGTAEDKFVLFAALGNNFFGPARVGFVSSTSQVGAADPPSPAQFDHLLTMSGYPSVNFWMDLSIEVAPFRMIPAQFREKPVFVVGPAVENRWERVDAPVPFPSSQKVEVRAAIDREGKLAAKVSYALRGDNELLLRLAFHQAPKEKWKDLAQLLSISDGFRGQVTSVNASDPYATREPFTVEYEITQPKFVDWSKKPVRIPALLPQLGLPDPPTKPTPGAATSPIELGTPLEVETHMTLQLPAGTTALTPTGTTVQRDYATFASQYSTKGLAITASRHTNFLLREIPATRATDYNAFLRAVQSDEAQDFTLEREDSTAPVTKPGAPKSPAPTQAVRPKP